MKKILFLCLMSLALTSCKKEDEPKVTSIVFAQKSVTCFLGDSKQLVVNHSPLELPAPDYNFASSHPEIVSVDNKGNFTALKVGVAKIVVGVDELGLKTVCTVIVLPIKATSIKFDKATASCIVGETVTIKAVLEPANTTNLNLIWSSSNADIATVKDGVVTTFSDGEVSITAKSAGAEEVAAMCEITVLPVRVASISFSEAAKTIELESEYVIQSVVLPANAKDKSIVWSSSNNGVATVSNGVVKGVSLGTCSIFAKTNDGGLIAECKLTVVPISVKEIWMHTASVSLLVSMQKQLTYTIIPQNAANKNVVWTSSNSSVASVTSDGLVTGKAIGSTTITATTADGGFVASSYIFVCDITSFIVSSVRHSSITNFDGIVSGTLVYSIRNDSNSPILITGFYIRDYETNKVAIMADQNDLGLLHGYDSKELQYRIRSVYKPIGTWTYTFEGKMYSVSSIYQ